MKEQIRQEIKQELNRRRKKSILITLLIVAMLIIGLLIYIKCNESGYNKNELKIISREEFSQYTTEIPITIENWKDYIDLEDVSDEHKNDFGEITNIYKNTKLKLKDNMYGYMILEIEYTNYSGRPSNKTIIISPNYFYSAAHNKSSEKNVYDYTITTEEFNNLKCLKAVGKVYTLNLPQDIWQTANGEKQFSFRLGNSNSYRTYYEDTYLSDLSRDAYDEYKQSIE